MALMTVICTMVLIPTIHMATVMVETLIGVDIMVITDVVVDTVAAGVIGR